MKRIDEVKSILERFTSDEASFSVIKVDGNKRQSCNPPVREKAHAHDTPEDLLTPQQVQHKDEAKTGASIVCPKNDRQSQKAKQKSRLLLGIALKITDHPQAEQSEQEGEHYILAAVQEIPLWVRFQGISDKTANRRSFPA